MSVRLPKIQQLTIFQAVASSRSINAAARSLGLPQSTLSRAVKELEETLNCQLFVRGGAGVTLTPAGMCFQRYASSIVKELHQAIEETACLSGKSQHTVSFAVPSCVSRSILNSAMTRLLRSVPQCRMNVEVVPFTTSLERVERGVLDFAIGYARENVSFAGFTVEPLMRCPCAVACAIGHSLEHATTLAELAHANWVLNEEFEIWQKEQPEALRLQPAYVVRSQGYFLTNQMVARNGFLALLSSVQIRRHRDHLTVIPLRGFHASTDYVLAYPKDRPRTALTERLIGYFHQEAAEYDWNAWEIEEGSPETPFRSQAHDMGA
ncbi:LysR family transcriptional regulator [Sutterella sp.]|uniref:LysR family transcriptional regulator n=1 Tax=Sutterella sp. TaxID=1981025 RepID=UPI0026E061EE|nr:LysR family transcriptional regulator [Sutterella sp.]MDO5532025.1 LysR family transcriptional regulator [Sutterella sp.]